MRFLAVALAMSLLSVDPGPVNPGTVDPGAVDSSAVDSSSVDPGAIPADRLPPGGWADTRWRNPGGFYTVDVSTRGLPANNSGVDASAKIRDIIATTSGNRVLYFPPGAYYFGSTLNITTDGIILRGAGRAQTRFLLSAADVELKFSGAYTGDPVSATVTGGHTITVPGGSAPQAGDFVQLYKNAGRHAYGHPIETQIFKVLSRSGDVLTLNMEIGLDYPASSAPMVRRIDMLENAGVDQLTIERLVQPTTENINNLTFHMVNNGFVEDIESVRSGRSHINIYWSKDISIDRNYVHGAFVMQNGYAYGISLNWGSTRVRVSDNKLWDLRHGILMQLGANNNVVSYNSIEAPYQSYNDLALHGTFAYMNLIEGNRFNEGYADNSKLGQGELEATGPGNTWFRNHATSQIGSINGQTARQNVIGNKLGLIRLSGTDHYHGANLEGGTLKWGSLSPSAQIPASLYTSTKPAFLGSTSWPVYGPGATDWGAANRLPAETRAR
ncbi:Pectate lyase superfamily protein [Nonomuraea solani]|uniref:Pectate lyase superfamily protein n=1 Tax=Nonomuraea solani TaxID=1144553 RepID=A0A1H6EG35_9ACTN|nr:glycosyl hydrolase family 28-related protein [Nonomuraea solani]SEG95794.1 Pectate lyase superfamily protein [Nonomuraea solani]